MSLTSVNAGPSAENPAHFFTSITVQQLQAGAHVETLEVSFAVRLKPLRSLVDHA